jgi:hypothetical protein
MIEEKKLLPSMIIFDNSDWYPESILRIDKKTGWPRVDFCGFSPTNRFNGATSFYLNPNKLLPRISCGIKPIYGTGEINENN